MYFKGTVFGDYQFLFQDLFIVLPLVVAMGYAPASHVLSVKRPSGNLLSFTNLASLLAHVIVTATFLVRALAVALSPCSHACVLAQTTVFELTSRQLGYVDVDNPDNGPQTFETTVRTRC